MVQPILSRRVVLRNLLDTRAAVMDNIESVDKDAMEAVGPDIVADVEAWIFAVLFITTIFVCFSRVLGGTMGLGSRETVQD